MGRVTYTKVVYRNGLERKFVWEDGIMTDTGTGEQTPMSWEYWDKVFTTDLRQQGFSFIPPQD